MVEVFKTNVDSVAASEELHAELQFLFPTCKINFDLDDCDRILRIEGNGINTETISKILIRNNYMCEILS
jgi:hypothetical protein